MHFCNCQYGFEYGAAKITRLFSDEKKGWITVEVNTSKETLQIYVTKTGKIRIHGASEWLPLKQSTPCQMCCTWVDGARYTFCPDCGRKLDK